MFEVHAGVRGAELPVDAFWGRVASLRPRGDLRGDRGLRRPARGQGLTRQDAQFRFGPVEPAAVTGRAQSTPVRRAVAWAVRHGPSGSTNIQIVQVPCRTYS